jgi:hypothetical protein
MMLLFIILIFFLPSSAFSESTKVAQSKSYNASEDVKYVVDMALKTSDNKNRPFVILDKKHARIYVFNQNGECLGDAPVLLGMAVGDDLSTEIARLPLSKIQPTNRITPAGRYIAEIGRDTHGQDVLWVDYNGNLAIHPVINVSNQHRLERLESENIDDNRISWGCINVPKIFFTNCIRKNFIKTKGIVYILPEVKSLKDYQWFKKN